MHNITSKHVEKILNDSKGKTIAVIGDVMLDRYFWGNVSRVSPEAPVPVIDIENETSHLGGAANVANNLKSLGIKSILFGVLGHDNSGKLFRDIAENSGIDCSGLYEDTSRPTTVKTRIIGNNQQIARLDREVRDSLSTENEKHILDKLNNLESLSGIIFEDYNKGTLSEFLILEITSFARINSIPIFVDPKLDNFFSYKHSTVFKPNKKEASQALGMELKNSHDIDKAGKLLLEKLECNNVLLTLGGDGMMLFENNGDVITVPTLARQVADVSGAGDTVIATLSACIAGGATVKESAIIANFAAGVVVEKPGIVSITPEEILESADRNHGK